MAVVGNTRETIALFHGSFAVLFSLCLSGPHQIPSGPRKRVKQWDRVKQRLIIGQKPLIRNRFCFGFKNTGLDRRCVSIHLERCRKCRRTTSDGT